MDDRRKSYRLQLAVLLALTLLVAAACGGGDDNGDGGESSSQSENGTSTGELTLASPAPNSLFTFNEVIARELGFYDEEGITVKVEALSDQINAAALIENGNVDTALISASDALAGATRTDNLQLPYDERTGGTSFIYGVVVPDDSEYKEMTDLEGTTIGLASPEQDLALLASALQEVGLSLDDVDHLVVGPGGPAVAESLRTGEIDAYTGTLADFAAFAEAGLETRNLIPETLEGLPVGGYVFRAEDLGEDSDAVKFLRALAKGTFVAIERPDVAAAVTKEVDPETWREPELAQFLIEGLTETLVPFDGTTFGEIKVDRWQDAQDLLIEVGALDEEVDLDTFLDEEWTAAINDWDRDEVLAQADEWLAENAK
jgi:ABC-type nitrate/sulfonate/bicarbonate transport system substrate-binding protein